MRMRHSGLLKTDRGIFCELTTTENTIIYYNARCFSPQNFA